MNIQAFLFFKLLISLLIKNIVYPFDPTTMFRTLSVASLLTAVIVAGVYSPFREENSSHSQHSSHHSSHHSSGTADTVDELDIDAYVGRWYQVYANQLVYDTMERGAYCVTADYAMKDDGTISVHNYQTTNSPAKGVKTIDGYAVVPYPNEPGQLAVSFPSVGNFMAPYWVFGLGPINAHGMYEWSIVSNPSKTLLFVLARDVYLFDLLYRDEVMDKVYELGFTDKEDPPIATYQEDDCLYEEEKA
jgi:apolipoprotein D and lipocalin family protein